MGPLPPASVAQGLIAGGAMQVSAGVYALTGGSLLSLTAAGWVLSHGPKGDIQDGPGYWLPGALSSNTSDEDGKAEAPEVPQDPTNAPAARGPSKTPNTGYPGTIYKNPGSGQERTYGPDGKPLTDIDFDHDHGQGVPH
ncbi:hypothetical protein [Rhodoblastus sp.]|uniref:hypothetical protein n=2 Tax=Rhodoblastus sp. TaxID=1962975 RepID=UPI003F96155A